MAINRNFFFEYSRINLFGGKFTQSQVNGISIILDAWETQMPASDDRWLAYMLGTAHHETGRTMQPVRETFASTDEAAVRILERAFQAGRLPWVQNPYWGNDNGKFWIGRGLVQITHKANYARLSQVLGIDLVTDPTVAMNPTVAVQIMIKGMTIGAFTGHDLARHFNSSKADWRNARRIINGIEKAELVAECAKRYYGAISYTV